MLLSLCIKLVKQICKGLGSWQHPCAYKEFGRISQNYAFCYVVNVINDPVHGRAWEVQKLDPSQQSGDTPGGHPSVLEVRKKERGGQMVKLRK